VPKLSFKTQLLLLSFLLSLLPGLVLLGLILYKFSPLPDQIFFLTTIVLGVSVLFALLNLLVYTKILEKHFGKLFFLLNKTTAFIPQQSRVTNQGGEVETVIRTFESLKQTIENYSQKNQKLEQFIKFDREKLDTVLTSVTDPVIGLDLKGNISFYNHASNEVLGLDPTDSLNQPLSQLFKFYDHNKEIPLNSILKFKQSGFSGNIFSQKEIKAISLLNNKEAFINLDIFQIGSGTSFNLCCILIFHDITKEKQLEAMKLDFVSMAAHELRTPLTSIKGYLSVFIQENEKKLNEDQMMFIRRIGTSAQQLSALVENLLGVARVERGAMSITTQPMDWIQNVQTQKEMFEHRAQEKRIELIFQKPTTPIPTLQADNVRINEVLNNFISNAINYTEPGGKIVIWIEYKNHEVITHVTDTGRGIPKEAAAHLFTKFYRVPGNVDQSSKGNGLGLYISKAIVDLHKGKIWADSEGLGKGSTFSFSLPVVETGAFDLSLLTKKL
jgi:two-component system, OmpR family, phosphate regulon sensor histidine kinase PhoR